MFIVYDENSGWFIKFTWTTRKSCFIQERIQRFFARRVAGYSAYSMRE